MQQFILFDDIEPLVQQGVEVGIRLGPVSFHLDLRYRHERAYAAKLLLRVAHPQCDIDDLLIRLLVRPGDRVLDAGAHVGFTAYQMLRAGAQEVIALEPVPAIYRRLAGLCAPAVQALPLALSDSEGSGTMILSASHNQGSTLDAGMRSLFPDVFGQAPEVLEVEVTTIDRLTERFGPMAVWKLDIEGAEPAALRGAATTLARTPPRAIIAELYEPYRDEFLALAAPTHPHAYRAFLKKETLDLVLRPPRQAPDDEGCHMTSPMYVVSREPLV